jgi:hypothetical protein
MAKRTRYPNRTSSRAAKRPQRPSGSAAAPAREPVRPATGPIDVDVAEQTFDDMPLDMPIRSSSGLTEAEVQRAEQLEAEATARERAAIADSLRRQAARGDAAERALPRGDINAPLSVRMAHEYAYVARDVRRILLTAGLMVAILAALAILINFAGVIKV